MAKSTSTFNTMLSRCVCFRMWTDKDDEADQDIRRGSLPGHATTTGKPKTSPASSEDASDNSPGHAQIVVEGEAIDPSSETATPSEDGQDIPVAVAPASGGAIALPQAESIKRADDLLTEGGLLLTEVTGGKDMGIRRVELDPKTGTLSWPVDRLFHKGVEKVVLKEARIMSTEKLVKIGVAGKKNFYTFEACDENEAAAVSNCLVNYANKTRDAPIGAAAQAHMEKTGT